MTRILTFDIEVLSSMSADCGSIFCMAYKWHHKKKVHSMSVLDYPATYDKNIFDDSKLLVDIHTVLEQADILIGHNSKSTAKWGFDIKYINTRLLLNDLLLKYGPIQYKGEIDTYHDLAKKHLKLRSNKLIEIAKALNLPEELIDEKGDLDFPRHWNEVIIKKPGAAKRLIGRCEVDVLLTEMVYDKLKLFGTGLPNVGIPRNGSDFPCPQCGKRDKINNKDTVFLKNRGAYKRLICRRCNKTFPGPKI